MAPIELNSVAPCRRAASRNPPAEKPGSSTRLARATSEPSVEYAGALMWKSGNDVISRSSLVSRNQYGKPSPAITYARCVCITSFDRPVVPDVGIITATSPGSSVAGPRPSGSDSNSAPTSTRAAPPVADGFGNEGASASSVTINAGATCSTNPASSSALLFGLIGTWMAPTSMSANHESR